MTRSNPTKQEIVDAIKEVAKSIGHAPSRSEFRSKTGYTEYFILTHFPNWREAVQAAGLIPDTTNIKLDDSVLFEDWGNFVRKIGGIPSRSQYRRNGTFSPGTFEKHFGIWSTIPHQFREYAQDKPEWADVLFLLPDTIKRKSNNNTTPPAPCDSTAGRIQNVVPHQSRKLSDRPTYGDPLDFRGLRHTPVNEQGVVFLFGVIARELGFLVEAVQGGFPDCEAKRQIEKGKWQRVRIEFEFESRSFRDHGHVETGCDVIVCWRHNWDECPEHLEVIELESVIQTLADSED